MKRLFIFIILFLILLQVKTVTPQQRIFYDVFAEKSLLDKQVLALGQDNYGNLLIGTSKGVYYYNGDDFHLEEYEPLKDVPILSFLINSNDELLVGSARGIAIIREKGKNLFIENFQDEKFYPFSFFENINRVLIASTIGVLAIENDSLFIPQEFKGLFGKRCYKVLYSNGYYYVAARQGLFVKKINDVVWTQVLDFPVYGIEKDAEGKIWVSSSKGIYSVIGSQSDYVNGKIIAQDRYQVLYYYKERNSFFLPATNMLLEIKDGKVIDKFPVNNLVIDGPLLIDKDKNLWIGSFTRGLYRILDLSIKHYGRYEGLKSTIFGVFQKKDGTILLASDGQGILKFNNNHFEQIVSNPPPQLGEIYEDSKGRVWIGGSGGAYKLINNNLLPFNPPGEKKFDVIGGFYEEPDGTLWFLEVDKVYAYKNKKIKEYPLKGLSEPNNIIFGMDKLRNGKYLLAGRFGIAIFDKEKGDSHADKNVEIIDGSLLINQMEKLFNGSYAFASTNEGLIIYNPWEKDTTKKLIYITSNDGLISDNVFSVIQDKKNRLWIGTVAGLSIFDYPLFLREGKIKIENFGPGDPIIGGEYNQFGVLLDSRGRIWMSGVNGILLFEKPDVFASRKHILQPFIKKASVLLENNNIKSFVVKRFGEKLKIENLNYTENSFSFQLDAISFSNRNLLKYKFYLNSKDKSITKTFGWSKQNNIYLVNLSPNFYSVDIEVEDQFGNTQIVKHAVEFSIPTPFWQTKLFYSILIFTIAFIVLLSIVIRERSLKRRNFELQKLLEDKKQLAEELEKSKNEYQTLFENAFNPMIIVDYQKFRVIDANNAACTLFGYTLKDFKETKLWEIFDIAKDDFEKHYKNFKKTGVSYTHLEIRLKKKNGETIDAEVNGKLIRYKGVDAAILVIKDVTAEKIAARNLKLSIEQLKKTEKMKANFLAQMSHEIRTPLSSITSYITLLKDELSDAISDDLEFAITSIVKSSRRIIRTVELMLNKSELDAQLYVINKENFDLIELLHLIIAEYREMAEFQGIELNLNYDKKHIIVFGDYYSFKTIFSNLIDNAIKYTLEGEVSINVISSEKNIIVDIIDTGIGIKKEYLPHLFTAFSQEEEGYTRKFDGNGLGLSVVKSFCDLNNCKIEVESEKGKGSTFRVIITKES